MKQFDFRRFGLVLRRDLVENRRRYISLFATWALALLAVLGFSLYSYCRYGVGYGDPDIVLRLQLMNVARVVLPIYVFSLVVGVSGMFDVLCSKQKRISYLMMPATMLEKFLSRLFVVTVVWTAGFALALVAADAVRFVLFLPLEHNIVCSLTAIPSRLVTFLTVPADATCGVHASSVNRALLCCVWAYSLWVYTFFMLGASIFRRRPLVLTALSLMALGCVLTYVATFVPVSVWKAIDEGSTVTMVHVLSGVFAVLAALNVWWSYRNLRRCPVIAGKWLHF